MRKGREAPESLACSIKMALLKLQLMSEKMASHALLTCLLSSCAVYASAVLAFRNWQVSINPPLGAVYRLDIMIGMLEVIKKILQLVTSTTSLALRFGQTRLIQLQMKDRMCHTEAAELKSCVLFLLLLLRGWQILVD